MNTKTEESQLKKSFIFETVLHAGDICNLKRERTRLDSAIKQKKKLVVYGPRNCGKTSLIQRILIPEFKRKNKKSFILNLDLMELKSEEDLSKRIKRSFEKSFSHTFPNKNLWNMAKEFISKLRPTIEIDPITSQSSISITTSESHNKIHWQDIFDIILKDIAPKIPTLIVMDEFQDIIFVDGAQGQMRSSLQYFNNIPIILLGSKRHLLSKIFAVPSAPFAQFGEDLEFHPITYKEYHDYIVERFIQKNIIISEELSTKLQDFLARVPESINIICDDILNSNSHVELTWELIVKSIVNVIDNRKSRYQSYLSFFSESEIEILVSIQKVGAVKQPNGKEFLNRVSLSGRTIRNIIKYLHDHSVIEDNNGEGYRIADPLLGLFIGWYK